MIDPPYVYGFFPGEQENSAVFWCKKEHATPKYQLVLASRKTFFDDWNYEIIIKTENYPRGLSILKTVKLDWMNSTISLAQKNASQRRLTNPERNIKHL